MSVGSQDTFFIDFLKEHRCMTLATASLDGKPEAATVQYVIDGGSLLINTFVHYRKFSNLVENPVVACVVTAIDETRTLQFEATALLLENEAALDAKQKMLAKDPDFENFFSAEHTRFFKLQVTWARLRDYTKTPVHVQEVNF